MGLGAVGLGGSGAGGNEAEGQWGWKSWGQAVGLEDNEDRGNGAEGNRVGG